MRSAASVIVSSPVQRPCSVSSKLFGRTHSTVRVAPQKIDHPWLPATAPRIVTTLSASSTQCARCSQAKATAGRAVAQRAEMAVQDEGLGDEQDEREQQPKADHGVHPPEAGRAEAVPEIEPPDHVERRSGRRRRWRCAPARQSDARSPGTPPAGSRPDRRAAPPAARRWSPSRRRRSR